jgi:hypothetical protein
LFSNVNIRDCYAERRLLQSVIGLRRLVANHSFGTGHISRRVAATAIETANDCAIAIIVFPDLSQ